MFQSLRPLLGRDEHPVCAPLVLNPMMARLAESAGFPALYLGGGATGYSKATLEATLGLSEMAQIGTELAAVTELPIVLDGACGWGDPMHIVRTIETAEAAGFAAIEIEDQVVPKQASHHVGIEHLVSQQLMVAKVQAAVASRRSPDFLIVARTNASDPDEALRRGEAYRAAGADMLLVTLASIDLDRIGFVAERLGGPLMYLSPIGGMARVEPSLRELGAMGYQLVADGQTPFLVMYAAAERTYHELAATMAIAEPPAGGWKQVQQSLHEVIGLQRLLDIESAASTTP